MDTQYWSADTTVGEQIMIVGHDDAGGLVPYGGGGV